ncbi:hypothetical protein [Paraglaciecola sp. L3A3]|uniref:hypothetical protein n=1 Tax=Paraglaciecola sp. L3A3 TaxID=2686358 RepID=UPI00131AC13E|nr:hypothetical protein [Paraglaciecola sp. L3A3]
MGADHQGCVIYQVKFFLDCRFDKKANYFMEKEFVWSAAFYKVRPVLCPTGNLADVQNGSRPFCLVTLSWLLKKESLARRDSS